MQKEFNAKKSRGLIAVLLVISGVPLLFFLYHEIWAGVVVLVAAISFTMALIATTRYVLTDKGLIVYHGFLFRTCVPPGAIREIRRTDTMLSAPAPSLDRLEILYNQFDLIVISPEDQKGLIHALLEKNPQIIVPQD